MVISIFYVDNDGGEAGELNFFSTVFGLHFNDVGIGFLISSKHPTIIIKYIII